MRGLNKLTKKDKDKKPFPQEEKTYEVLINLFSNNFKQRKNISSAKARREKIFQLAKLREKKRAAFSTLKIRENTISNKEFIIKKTNKTERYTFYR